MNVSQVGQLNTQLPDPSTTQGSADFNLAVKSSRLGLSNDLSVQNQGSDAKLDSLLQKLVSVLQPQSNGLQGPSPFRGGPGPVVPEGRAPFEGGLGPVVHGGPGPVVPHRSNPFEGGPGPVVPNGSELGREKTEHLLQHVINGLNKQLDSGKLDPQQSDLVAKLLPKLEQKLVSIADPQQGATGDETKLLHELNNALGGSETRNGGPTDRQSGTKLSADTPPQASNPGAGIGSAEISAMIANADGEGPAVNFASYDQSSPQS